MTPKENAIELYNKYDNLIRDFTKGVSIKNCSKQCALIVVDEILKDIGDMSYGVARIKRNQYWQEVKQEIEKL